MAVPSWKIAIIARRKQLEDEERKKKAEMEAYLSSLPPWKRAMKLKQLEKEGKGDAQPTPAPAAESTPMLTASKPSILSKWKAAEEKSKTVKSPEPHPVPSAKQGLKPTGSQPPALSRWKEAVEKSKTVEVSEPYSVPASPTYKLTASKPLALSKWKEAEEKSKMDSEPHPEPEAIVQTSRQTTTTEALRTKHSAESTDSSAMTTTTSSPVPETEQAHEIFRDSAFLAQPRWKQDLILRKRGIKRPSPGNRSKPISSAVVQETSRKPLQDSVKKVEVVNTAMNDRETSKPEKLVSVEGKMFRPPIFQEVDEWANVDDLESNHKFKNLPLWHQALIKRKRDKRLLRSQPSESVMSTSQAADTEKKSEVSTPWSPSQASITSTTESASQSKQVCNEDFRSLASSTKSPEEKGGSMPSWLAEVRARKQHNRQAAKPSQLSHHTSAPVLHGVGMQVQATSTETAPKKSSPPHNTSSLVRSPSDLSDSASDLECTLIDDLSDDEEKEEELISSFSSESRKSSTSTVRPILKSSYSERRLRRVSFSDVQLTTEHVYPKYTYDDYFEIEQPVPESPDGLATPIHPWVSGSNSPSSSSSTKQPQKTLETSYLSNYSNPTFDSVLAAYAFNAPRTPSTRGGVVSPPSSTTGSRSSSTSSLGSNTDMYNLSNDTAALIW